MYTYWIAGVPKCLDFGHARLVAEKLKRYLPNFSYRIIMKNEKEYTEWFLEFCVKQGWTVYKNPLIWKRISNSNGPCHLIGGVNEFFQHIGEYYNIDTSLDKRLKEKIALDNNARMKLMSTSQVPAKRPLARRVCITGARYPSTGYLVAELLQLKQLHTDGGVTISIHQRDVDLFGDLQKIKHEISEAEFNIRGHAAVVVVNSIEEGLINCDLFIISECVERARKEDTHSWMNRNYIMMKSIAYILNRHCPESCKVLLMGMDFLCFNLSVLAEYAYKVYLHNIVGLTGHYGMKTLPTISRAMGIPVSKLHCPPVWGYVGLRKYVDIDHTVYCKRDPSDRRISAEIQHKYLRIVVIQSKDLADIVNDENDFENYENQKVCPLSCLPEVRAAVRMISEWFAGNDHKGETTTISAAIFSDGTFGLPFGMFMSQPVVMENGEWKPNFDFPPPAKEIIDNMINLGKYASIEFSLGERFNRNWRDYSNTKLTSD